jgi:hypothetical protein
MSAEEIDVDEFVKYLSNEKVFVEAKGNESPILFYCYSYETQTDCIFLTELKLDFNTGECSYLIKSEKDNLQSKYEDYFLKIIEPIIE